MTDRVRTLLRFLRARSSEVIDHAHLERAITSGRKLRVKLGIDPTTPELHLGHVVPLRALRAFQDAGHRAVLIIGDFTAQIGDPSGRENTRRTLSAREAKVNERTYLAAIRKIINLRRTEVRHNSEWYSTMRLSAFFELLARFSLQSATERDDFKQRLQAGREVELREALYPVLQAYDSVAVRADIELGALDQKLNVLAGRDLQRKMGAAPQDVVLLPYLIGLDGKAKMSKTAGNTVGLTDAAGEMFGKLMSIPDNLIVHYAELAAWLDEDRVREITRSFERGENPRDLKLDVAEAVTRIYHGAQGARRARSAFTALFSRRERPASIPGVKLPPGGCDPIQLLAILNVGRSNSERRRLVHGGALEVNGLTIRLDAKTLHLKRGSVIRAGKKQFFRVQ